MSNSQNDRNAIGDQARWPKGVVPYKFDSSLSEKSFYIVLLVATICKNKTKKSGDLAKKAVMAAIADFEKFTCVRFVPRTNQPNYLTILNDGNGYHLLKIGIKILLFHSRIFYYSCWSYVGMTRGAQQLGLSEGCETKGTALHELMHALGIPLNEFIVTHSRF